VLELVQELNPVEVVTAALLERLEDEFMWRGNSLLDA
jgi:hypothetical protein